MKLYTCDPAYSVNVEKYLHNFIICLGEKLENCKTWLRHMICKNESSFTKAYAICLVFVLSTLSILNNDFATFRMPLLEVLCPYLQLKRSRPCCTSKAIHGK